MTHRLMTGLALWTVLALTLGGLMPTAPTSGRPSAFLDPALAALVDGTASVIVTAAEAGIAEQAVRAAGGTVSSDLWLIDAVAATLPAAQLQALAAYPGLTSIVANTGVSPARGPVCDPLNPQAHGPCASRDGWVTDRREKKTETQLAAAQKVPIMRLPDGGFIAIGDNGRVTFLNSDGSPRQQLLLGYKNGQTAPVIGPDGSSYFTGIDPLDSTKTIVFALNPNGTVRWTYTNKELLAGGLAVDARGYLYVSSIKPVLYVLDQATGVRRWEIKPSGDKPGIVQAPPVVGPDGRVYLMTSGVNPGSTDTKGNLFAIDPALFATMGNKTSLSVRWRFVGDLYVTLEYGPVLSNDGQVYLVSTKKRILYAVDMASGARRYSRALPDKTTSQPIVGPDGTLYLPSEKNLLALNPDGSTRFSFSPDLGFETAPIFSADGSLLLAAAENTLYALDPATGTVRWQVSLAGKIRASAALDPDGNIVVGSEGKDLLVVSPAGAVISRLPMSDKVVVPALTGLPNGDTLVLVGDKDLVKIGWMPEAWDGRPDAEPAELRREWRLSNAISIDVGADVLHGTHLPDGAPITGQGTTIAVVDSGVFFTSKVRDILGADLDEQFLGQADFVGTGTCTSGGSQMAGYCWAKKDSSSDPYGHGSHVAGIIWSQITDYATGAYMGVAPNANILSVRVLGADGSGTYEDVIEGLQYVVANRQLFNVRVLNLSLSAPARVPYFVDPLNRAVERAWASGIVVLAAAGNSGPGAETITVPGNDPYVITVGAINDKRTPGYWADDTLPNWSANGPTLDGFVKPDILAPGVNVISFMYTDKTDAKSAALARQHPDYVRDISLFRMNGTSMATAVASGVAALVLQANPSLTPDQVKYRLMASAVPAFGGGDEPIYTVFRQGAGRLWAPQAALGEFPADSRANYGMDLAADLAHGYEADADMAFHYQGLIVKLLSDDGQLYLYYADDANGDRYLLGVARESDMKWLDQDELPEGVAWDSGRMIWAGGRMIWAGGLETTAAGRMIWAGGRMIWAGGRMIWAGSQMVWDSGRMIWAGGRMIWAGNAATWASGRMIWAGMSDVYAGGRMIWAGQTWAAGSLTTTTWVDDEP